MPVDAIDPGFGDGNAAEAHWRAMIDEALEPKTTSP
jgi:hypothetical protein